MGWSYDDKFIAMVGSALLLDQIENYYFDGTNITLAGVATGLSNMQCLSWHPSAYYFATGDILGNLRIYSVGGILGNLTLVSSTLISLAVFYDIAWHPTGSYIACATSGLLAKIRLYPVSSGGILGVPLVVNATFAAYSCAWSNDAVSLAVGFDAADANGLKVYTLSAGPTLTLNAQAAAGYNVVCMRWNPVYTNILAIGLNNTSSGDSMQIYRYNASAGTLTKLTAITNINAAVTSVDWSNDGNCLLVSNGATDSTTNKLNVYRYDAVGQRLIMVSGQTFTNITTNTTPARYSPVNNYIAQATVTSATTAYVRISSGLMSCNTLSNLMLVLHNDLYIQNSCITFAGNCSILGNGYALSLAPTATLIVASNSAVTCNNLTLTGFCPRGLQMTDQTSSLVLNNTELILNGNYTFAQGALGIVKDVTISGAGGQFVYASNGPCTIRTKSSLCIDERVTFSYAPLSVSNSLIQCTDASSKLFLRGATLVATTTGLSLTRGTLAIDGHAYIVSDAINSAQGVSLGNGVASGNITIQIYPDAVLEVTKGMLVHNNV